MNRTYFSDLTDRLNKINQKYFSYNNAEYTKSLVYDPPMSKEEILYNYGEKLYNKLMSDPVHKWRAETGIELIHKEPTKEELIRIYNNFLLMPNNLKVISDKKSIELFGLNNVDNFRKLVKLY